MEENLGSMGSYLTIAFVVAFIFGILQIILFFKLWIMTNDVRKIRNKLLGGINSDTCNEDDNKTDKYSIRIVSFLFTLVTLVGIAFIPMWAVICVLLFDIVLLIYAFTRK